MKSAFVAAATVLVALSLFNGAEGASCLQKLSTSSKVADERATCVKTLKIKEADVVDISNLKEKHFNDSCLSNCVLENLKFSNNGTILKDKILEQMKSEADSDVYEKLAKIVTECSEPPKFKSSSPRPTRSTSGTADGRKHKDGKKFHGNCACKKAARFVHCMMEKDKDLC